MLGFALGPRGLLNTNRLVCPIRNGRVGSLKQREGPTQMGSHSGGI